MSIDLPWYLEDSKGRRYTGEYANKLKKRRTEAEKQTTTNEAMVNNVDDNGREQRHQESISEEIYNLGYKYDMLDVPLKPFVGSLKDLMDRDALTTFQSELNAGLNKSWMDSVLDGITCTSFAIRIWVLISCVGAGILVGYKKIKRRKACIQITNTDESSIMKNKKKRKRKKKNQVVHVVTRQSSICSTICNHDSSTDLIVENDGPNHPKNILDVFSHDVPKMADIISRSGLSRQESIKIAAQEVFAIQRLQNEESRKREDERRARLKMKAEASIKHIQEELLSSIYGNRFLICLGISSLIRILMSHFNCISGITLNKDQTDVTRSLLHWMVSVICGACTKESKQCSLQNEMTLPTTTSYFSFMFLYYSGIEHFFPSAIFPSGSASCLTSIVTYFVATAFGHRLLRMFHSDALHRAWNILLLISFCLNTNLGQSLLLLVIQLCTLNAALAASMYIRINHQMKQHNMDSDYLKTMGSHHEQWIELSNRSSKTLKLMNISVSIFFGFLPS
jgi:hypothetical protein